MYEDPKRWGYLFQSYVLLTMMDLHHKQVVSWPQLITLGAHAQRGYGSWLCLCVCVCLSVTLHLTSRVFVRLTKDTTYVTGNEGQDFRFLWKCSVAKLERFQPNTGSRRCGKGACGYMLIYLDRARLLCVSLGHKKSEWRACIDSRMLSTTVANPCQTLRELLL